jgi:hypothetical protein
MQVVNDDTVFNGKVSFRFPPEKDPSTLVGLTPTINGAEFVIGGGIVVSITNFLGGINGQDLKILGDGTTTLVHGTYIKTNTGANKLLAANKIYRLTYLDSAKIWYEDA